MTWQSKGETSYPTTPRDRNRERWGLAPESGAFGQGSQPRPVRARLEVTRQDLRPGPRPARRQIFSPIPRARPPPRRLRERRFDTLQPRAAAPRHTASRAASRCSDRARGSARHGACELSHVFALAVPVDEPLERGPRPAPPSADRVPTGAQHASRTLLEGELHLLRLQ